MNNKLKVKPSDFKKTLSFNEWVVKYRVSSCYVEPTKYYQGNAGSPEMSMDTRMEMCFTRKTSGEPGQNLIGKILALINLK
jgi:hypothetical protein